MRPRHPVYLCVALILPAVLAVAADTRTAGERLQFANGLYGRGLYAMAAREYAAYLRDHPDSDQADTAFFRMGESYRQTGDRTEAEKAFRRVFAGYPESEYRFRAGFMRAELFAEAGQGSAAIDLYGKVLAAGPPPDIAAAVLYSLSEVLIAEGRKPDAVRRLEELRARHADSQLLSYALLQLGRLYGEQPERHEEAVKMFHAAAAKPASDRVGAEALFQLAEFYYRAEQYDRSAQTYRELFGRYPKDQRSAEARLQAGWAAQNAGLYAEALRLASDALQGGGTGNLDEWLYLKANSERQLMKNVEAAATYQRLVGEHPDSRFVPAARYELALTSYKAGRFRQAVEAAALINLKDSDIAKDVYWLLAESHAALDEQDDAIQYYRLVTRDFPDSDVACDATYRLAHHLQECGDLKEAARVYNELVTRFPESALAAQAMFASAVCLAAENRHAEAARDWSLLLERYPDSRFAEEAMYQRAMSEIRLERDDQARASLEAFLKRFAKSEYRADAYYWLGVLLAAEKRGAEAEERLRRCLESQPRLDLRREAAFSLGSVLQSGGKFAEAADTLQPLLATPARERFTNPLLEWLAEYQHSRERYPEAVEAAGALCAPAGEPAWKQTGHGLAGRAYLAQGDKEKARGEFERALEYGEKTAFAPESALHLGTIMLGGSKPEEARGFFERAAGMSGEGPLLGIRARAYEGLGRTAMATGDFEGAARYFMSVAVLYDDDELVPRCLHQAAGALLKAGDTEGSQKALHELKTDYPDSPWAKEAAPD